MVPGAAGDGGRGDACRGAPAGRGPADDVADDIFRASASPALNVPRDLAYGGAVLEMAGACWVLPEFNQNLGKVELVTTFKQHLVAQLNTLVDHEGTDAALDLTLPPRSLYALSGAARYEWGHSLVPAGRRIAMLFRDRAET